MVSLLMSSSIDPDLQTVIQKRITNSYQSNIQIGRYFSRILSNLDNV